MRFARLRLAALAVVAAAVAACSSSDAGLGVTDPDIATPGSHSSGGVANFVLQSVNAKALPAEMRRDATGTMSITRGVLALSAGNFVQTLSLFETTFSGQTSTRDVVTQGTYSVRGGGQIHFQASDGGSWDATYDGAKIEYSVAGNSGQVTFVFVRS